MNRSSDRFRTLIGCRVEHPRYGYGVIVRLRYGGIHSQVLFHNGMRIWVRTLDLRVLTNPTQTPADTWHPPGDRVQILQMVEAFRLGTVPRDDVPHFTFGRDEHIDRVREVLDRVRAGGDCALIEGPYGSGKTHLLEFIAHMAMERGFAVAWAELDPFEVTPYKPKTLYRSLMATLVCPRPDGSVATWTEVLLQARDAGVVLDPPHVYLTPLLKALHQWKDADRIAQALAWIGGEMFDRVDLNEMGMYGWPTMLNHSTAADHLGYLLSGWTYLLRHLGYAGLVVLIDEAETVAHMGLRVERARGFNTLRGLIALAQNRPEVLQMSPLAWDERDRAYKDTTGFVHSGVRPLPYAYRLPTYLGLFIAATPMFQQDRDDWRSVISSDRRFILWPLLDTDFYRMTHYFVRMVQAAYPELGFTTTDVEVLFQILRRRLWQGDTTPHPRAFLKGLAELLALKRRYPQEALETLAEEPRPPHLIRVQ